MQRHGTEIPTRAEIPVLRAVEALGTAWPRDVAPAAPSLGAARVGMHRLARRGLLQRTDAGYTVAHTTDSLIALMMEGL